MSNVNVRAFADELRRKIAERQHGVPTFADQVWLALIAHLEQGGDASDAHGPEAVQRLEQLMARRSAGRFVDYATRRQGAGHNGASDIGYFDLVMSQGVTACLQWKGLPLFKTVYDFSLYPMILWALRPRTVIELGSGAGASAVWLADMAGAFGLDAHVYSVDLQKPAVAHERVTFVEGDCEAIASVFDEAALRGAPHPWLLLEDAHVDVFGVLRYLHRFTRAGDYVIVEDSAGKQDELRRFIVRHPGAYAVDTHYTDFFGRNATCAEDSIFVRTSD